MNNRDGRRERELKELVLPERLYDDNMEISSVCVCVCVIKIRH